jgi:hypothetical protein
LIFLFLGYLKAEKDRWEELKRRRIEFQAIPSRYADRPLVDREVEV